MQVREPRGADVWHRDDAAYARRLGAPGEPHRPWHRARPCACRPRVRDRRAAQGVHLHCQNAHSIAWQCAASLLERGTAKRGLLRAVLRNIAGAPGGPGLERVPMRPAGFDSSACDQEAPPPQSPSTREPLTTSNKGNAMRGFIQTRDVFIHAGLIAREFGASCLLCCLWRTLTSSRPVTFLECVAVTRR